MIAANAVLISDPPTIDRNASDKRLLMKIEKIGAISSIWEGHPTIALAVFDVQRYKVFA
jgi:hypothetical protein